MKYCKKALALLLTVSILAGMLSVNAFASSETYGGNYEGYTYTCTATVTPSTCTSKMTYKTTTALRIDLTVGYINIYNTLGSTGFTVRGKSSVVFGEVPNELKEFRSNRSTFKIGTTVVQTIYVAV